MDIIKIQYVKHSIDQLQQAILTGFYIFIIAILCYIIISKAIRREIARDNVILFTLLIGGFILAIYFGPH